MTNRQKLAIVFVAIMVILAGGLIPQHNDDNDKREEDWEISPGDSNDTRLMK